MMYSDRLSVCSSSDPCNATISFCISADRDMADIEASSSHSPNCSRNGSFFDDKQNHHHHHHHPSAAAAAIDYRPPAEVHVLAVDDSLIDRRVIEKLLRTSAYKVTVVDSGIKALEILGIRNDSSIAPVNSKLDGDDDDDESNIKQGFEINLIITDYCMPEMTGYDLLKKIKATSALKEIPVVVMSSENVPNRISSCLAEGAEEFLLKPVQLSDVQRLRGHVKASAKPENEEEEEEEEEEEKLSSAHTNQGLKRKSSKQILDHLLLHQHHTERKTRRISSISSAHI